MDTPSQALHVQLFSLAFENVLVFLLISVLSLKVLLLILPCEMMVFLPARQQTLEDKRIHLLLPFIP